MAPLEKFFPTRMLQTTGLWNHICFAEKQNIYYLVEKTIHIHKTENITPTRRVCAFREHFLQFYFAHRLRLDPHQARPLSGASHKMLDDFVTT